MRLDRLARIRQQMRTAELDALVVDSTYNRRWLTGFTGSAGTVALTQEKAALLVDFRYTQQAQMQADGFTVIQVQEMPAGLAELFREWQVRRAGFESAHVVHKAWRKWQEVMPDVEWVPVGSWVEEARGCKDDEELAAIARACELTDQAFAAVLPLIRPGISERELALELELTLRRLGAEKLAFDSIVASGANGALPHAKPSDKEIRQGELVTLDFGAVWQGYCADMTRTVAVGHADSRQREIYELVLAAQQAGLAAVQPGKIGKDVDAAARAVIEAAGHGAHFGHGLGHGVGLQIHEEYPRLSRLGTVALQPRMVCSVEPGVYISGWGGIRIEDLVVVTPTGCQVLSAAPKELLVL